MKGTNCEDWKNCEECEEKEECGGDKHGRTKEFFGNSII